MQLASYITILMVTLLLPTLNNTTQLKCPGSSVVQRK